MLSVPALFLYRNRYKVFLFFTEKGITISDENKYTFEKLSCQFEEKKYF